MRGVWSPAVEGVRRYGLATWSVLGFHSPSCRDGPCHPSLSPRAVPQCRPGFVLHRRLGAPGRAGGPRQRQDPGPLHSAAQSTEGRPEAAWTRRGRGSQGAASWSEAARGGRLGRLQSRGRWQEVPQVRGLPPKLTLAPRQTPGPAGAAGRGAERGPHWAAPPGVAWCRPLACGARVSSPVGGDCHQCSVGPRPGAGVPWSGGRRPCPPRSARPAVRVR